MKIEVVAGVDIGGTNTVIALIERSGKILSQDSIKTTDFPKIESFVNELVLSINNLLSVDDYHLVGVGIGAPNANYHKGTIELAANLAWKGIVPLGSMVSDLISAPVLVTNDANAAAIGEKMFGGAQDMNDFIVLTLGTGLGSGIVVNGELVLGHTGFAGELGHTIIVPGGRACGCGRNGCLETYASASGLVKTALYMLSELREESPLRDVPPSKLTAKAITEEAIDGDFIAMEAIDYTAERLAFGIINAVSFSSPEAIFLFGGLANAGELLFKPVRDYVDMNIQPTFSDTVKILPSALPEANAAVLGAAALIWDSIK